MNARTLVICNEVFVPQNSGGRIDVGRHMEVLHALPGQTLALLTWYDAKRDGVPRQQQSDALNSMFESIVLFPIRRDFLSVLKRLSLIFKLPSHAASRRIAIDESCVLTWVREFNPSSILLHGLYGGAVAMELAAELGIPITYRSHNIEHRYMRMQFSKAGSLKGKLGLLANLIGLKKFENKVFSSSKSVFDISFDDLKYWRGMGFSNVDWLPPAVSPEFIENISANVEKKWDVAFFGNLNTPNNVDGLRWFFQRVLPLIRFESVRILLTGSMPNKEVRQYAKDIRVTLVENPLNIAALAAESRILINPVRAGSGVNLKSVEMLFSNAVLISTEAGVGGLPDTIKSCFSVFDDAKSFANAIDDSLRSVAPIRASKDRLKSREVFDANAIGMKISRELS